MPRKEEKLQVQEVSHVASSTQSNIRRTNSLGSSHPASDEAMPVEGRKIYRDIKREPLHQSADRDQGWDYDSDYESNNDKMVVDHQKQQVHLASQRTLPSSKFYLIEKKEEEAKIHKGERKNLSKSNFQYDSAGNAIYGSKLLKAGVAQLLKTSKDVKGLKVGEKTFYKIKSYILSKEDMDIIYQQLSKSEKNKISKVNFVETTEILKSNCWVEEGDALDAIIGANVNRIKQQKLDYLKAIQTKVSSNVQPIIYDHNPNTGLESLDKEIEEQSSKCRKILINSDTKMEAQTTMNQEVSQTIEMPQSSVTGASTPIENTTQQVVDNNLLLSLQNTLEIVNQRLVQMEIVQKEMCATIKALEEENKKLKEENESLKKSKDEIKLDKLPETTLKQEPSVSSEPKVQVQQKIKMVRSKSDVTKKLVSKFEDDGIDKKITLSENATPKEAMEVLKNTTTLSKEQQKKVISQGKRELPKSSVKKETTFSEALDNGLVKSDQTVRVMKEKPVLKKAETLITFTPYQRENARRSKDCPPGILAPRWNFLKNQHKEEKALDNAIRKEYYKILSNDLYMLRARWIIVCKKQNIFLCSPREIWNQIGDQKTYSKLHQSIKLWRKSAMAYVPSGSTIPKTWYSNSGK